MQTAGKWLLGGAAALLGYALYAHHKTAQAAGPAAPQAPNEPAQQLAGSAAIQGDQVYVPAGSIPQAALPPGVISGLGTVVIRVDTALPTTLQGPIVAYQIQSGTAPIPFVPVTGAFTGPVQVPRSAVTAVMRGGTQVA